MSPSPFDAAAATAGGEAEGERESGDQRRHRWQSFALFLILLPIATPPCVDSKFFATRGPGACARAPSSARPGRRRPAAIAARRRCVGAEDGHPHVVAEVDDHLRRGAQVDRALDDPLDPGRPRWPRRAFSISLDVELLRPHDRVAVVARAEGRGVGCGPSGPFSSWTSPPPSTVAGIRFETPMKPATKVVSRPLVDLDRGARPARPGRGS